MGTPSNLIVPPAAVAQNMRYAAERILLMQGLPPGFAEHLARLMRNWAAALEGAPRHALPEVLADRLTLAQEIETTACVIEAECACGGGKFELDAKSTPGFIAWLRECSRQAAELAVRAKGFHFDPDAPRVPAPHPDDVIPGLTTGAGEPVSYALLGRLAARRAGDPGARPCDSEEKQP